MKNKKNILLFIFLAFLFLFHSNTVKANYCTSESEYDCAYCSYELNQTNGCFYNFSVVYKGDGTPLKFIEGDGGANVASVTCKFAHNFIKDNFKDSSGNVICPNVSFNQKVTPKPRGAEYTLTFSAGVSGTIKPKTSKIKKGTNSNAEIKPTTVCTYSGACGDFTASLIDGKIQIESISGFPAGAGISNALDAALFEGGKCPTVYTYHNLNHENKCYFTTDKSSAGTFNKDEGVSVDQNTGESTDEYDNDKDSTTNPNINELSKCDSLLGAPNQKPNGSTPGSPAFYLNVIFSVLRYVAIAILIVLSVMDFLQATAAHDDDAIKKATSKTIKRVVMCVIIFVLPTLIEFILQFIHDKAIDTCGIGGV